MSNYPGNKKIYGVYHKIINNIPEHSRYFELFAGSGAIANLLYDIPGDTDIFINDINNQVTNSYNYPCDTIISNLSIIDFFNKNIFTSADFLFLDPPYFLDTRSKSKQVLYGDFEMTESDHIQFLSEVQKIKSKIMIIHPDCNLYNDALQSWRKIPIKIRYNRKTSIENLYMNYPDGPLQTYKFLGKDCWDRQRIKRKSVRYQSKFKGMIKLF